MARYSVLQIADEVLRIIERGNLKLNKPYDRREVARLARDVTSELLHGSYIQKKQSGVNEIYSQYVVIFEDIEVKKDSRGVCYSELPADPDDLPDNTGIMNIWPVATGKAAHNRPIIPLPLTYSHLADG